MPKITCPFCGSKRIHKKAIRELKYRKRILYQCVECDKYFNNEEMPNKTYKPNVIINSLNYYNLGNTLEKTSKLVNQRFKVKTSQTTIYNWLNEFSQFCPFRKLRREAMKEVDGGMLFERDFRHGAVKYPFKYHKFKLDILGSLYSRLIDYIKGFGNGCPDIFDLDEERCSQPVFDVKPVVEKKKNFISEMTDFALKSVKRNKERHDAVEEFMLVNDVVTIACEVPVWFWEKSIDSGFTGHIDLLQVKNGRVFILDYKPDARKEKKAPAQLYHYASGLSFRTKIPLGNFRCAWFDRKDYFEFEPSEADVSLINSEENKKKDKGEIEKEFKRKGKMLFKQAKARIISMDEYYERLERLKNSLKVKSKR